MEIKPNDLRNLLATLSSLDRHEIEAAGYDMPDGSWHDFQENPVRRFLRCNDACRAAITAAICKRQRTTVERMRTTAEKVAELGFDRLKAVLREQGMDDDNAFRAAECVQFELNRALTPTLFVADLGFELFDNGEWCHSYYDESGALLIRTFPAYWGEKPYKAAGKKFLLSEALANG